MHSTKHGTNMQVWVATLEISPAPRDDFLPVSKVNASGTVQFSGIHSSLCSARFGFMLCCQAGYFVLEFYKDRIKKQSVKNFMLHNSRGQFIMQFGRSKEDNVFALDFTGPFSPLAAFGVALVRANMHTRVAAA